MGHLHQLAISDDGFVFDPTTGQSFTVSSTGYFILTALKHENTLEQIVADLTETYEVSHQEAEQDALDFMAHLKNHRLL